MRHRPRHHPVEPPRPLPRRRRNHWLVPATVLAAAVVALLVWPRIPPIPTVDLAALDNAELSGLIERHVTAVRSNSTNAEAWAALGSVYEANQLWEPALACYRRAAELDLAEPIWAHRALVAWLNTGDMDGAHAWLREEASRFPSFVPLQHRYGIMLLESGELAEAKRVLHRVTGLAPNSPAGYAGVGEAALAVGDYQEAVTNLKHALQLAPEDKMARYLLGRAYRGLGRLDEAERALAEGRGGTRRYFDDAWSAKLAEYAIGVRQLQTRADRMFREGRLVEAAELLRQVLAAEPDNVEAAINLGTIYVESGQLEEARQMLEHAATDNPDRFEIHVNLAACLQRMDRPAEALVHAERATALAPEVSATNLARGEALMRLDRHGDAREALLRAVRLDPDNATAVQHLANVHVRLGQYSEALGQYEALSKLMPDRWEPYLGIARMHVQLGNMQPAILAVDAGLKLAPDEPELLALAQRIMDAYNR